MIANRHRAWVDSPGGSSLTAERELRKAWSKHQGQACRFFDQWQMFSVDQLALAPQVLKPVQLTAIMDRLFSDFGNHRRGLPDLFITKDARPLFVEVKAKGERISPDQTGWHEFLIVEAEVPVEICRVVEE